MNRYKIYVYAISKDEEKFADRWLDSMSEADLVIVTDTGSTDATVEKLRGRGALVYEEEILPWRFDKARNISLAHVPQDADICVCTDLDEVFRPGWRQALEKTWTINATKGTYLYNWSLKPDGTPATQFHYSKVHRRNGYEWVCPVHEYLKYTGLGKEVKVFIEGMILDHYPDSSKSRSFYLPLLEMAAIEDPQGERVTYYLGREYHYAGRWQDCIDTLQRYLALPSAIWSEERSAAMSWIAKSYQKLKKCRKAFHWFYRAIAEAPHMRDPYVECALLAYEQNDWPSVFFMTNEALKIKRKSETFINNDYAWDHTLEDLAAVACYQLGLFKYSLAHAQEACRLSPNNERLIENLRIIKKTSLSCHRNWSPEI